MTHQVWCSFTQGLATGAWLGTCSLKLLICTCMPFAMHYSPCYTRCNRSLHAPMAFPDTLHNDASRRHRSNIQVHAMPGLHVPPPPSLADHAHHGTLMGSHAGPRASTCLTTGNKPHCACDAIAPFNTHSRPPLNQSSRQLERTNAPARSPPPQPPSCTVCPPPPALPCGTAARQESRASVAHASLQRDQHLSHDHSRCSVRLRRRRR